MGKSKEEIKFTTNSGSRILTSSSLFDKSQMDEQFEEVPITSKAKSHQHSISCGIVSNAQVCKISERPFLKQKKIGSGLSGYS